MRTIHGHWMAIALEHAAFDEASIDKHGMGAGVVPVAFDDSGNIRVLLGRERYMPQWRGSCRWSGFEGSRKDGEGLADTAVREFMEESLGVVIDEADISARLLSRRYQSRIVLKIHNEQRSERYHATYVVHVDWDETLPQRFKKLRLSLEHVDRLAQEWRYRRPNVFPDALDVGPIEDCEGEGVHVLSSPTSTCIVPSSWVPVPETRFLRIVLYGSAALDVREWRGTRARVQRSIVDHPCVSVRRDADWEMVQDAKVIKDHLEKDQIRWWTLDELDLVMANRGQLGTDRFRPYFLPVLQTMLKELRDESVTCLRVDSSPVPPPAPRVFDPSPSEERLE